MMTVAPRPDAEASRPSLDSRRRPLVYASIVFAIFVTTIAVLAIKAGTSVDMLTTILAIVLAASACGLCGIAMASRDSDHGFKAGARPEDVVDDEPVVPTNRAGRIRS